MGPIVLNHNPITGGNDANFIWRKRKIKSHGTNRYPNFSTLINDPDVTEYLSNIFPYSLETETAWFESILKLPMAEHPLVIELALRTVRITGSLSDCAFMHITNIHRSAEVGIFLGEKEYWSQGYGTQAMRLLLKFGFEDLNFHRIWLRVLKIITARVKVTLKPVT